MVKSKWFLKVILALAAIAAPAVAQQPPVALLDSKYSRQFFTSYPNCNGSTFYVGEAEYDRYVEGWRYVLDGLARKIGDADVTEAGLSPYRVLVLSNAVRLSREQTRVIESWVRKGGRLVATFGSGYEDIVESRSPQQTWKTQEGGTFGLHNLWHDPASKAFGTSVIDPAHPGVDIRVTRFEGPTLGLALTGGVLHYGSMANVLIPRPEQYGDAYGFLIVNNPDWQKTLPAILVSKAAKGLVVYFAFAPEYLVSLRRDLVRRCDNDTQVWPEEAAREGSALMLNTVNFLLAH